MNLSPAEYQSIEKDIRTVLKEHPGSIIDRDTILIGMTGPIPRQYAKLPKDVYRTNLRRKITKVMNRIVLGGEWEVYGSPRNPRWRRVS